MAGILSSFVLTGLLAAGPVGFTFDGPEATARTVGNVGFFTQGPVPFTDLFERGRGSAELSVQDRIADPRATYGDVGRLVATFELAGVLYRVELDQAGFPPGSVSPPAQAIAGGVVLNQDLHGGAPLGFSNMSRERAAAAVWGVGRVWRNGELLTDSAVIHAAALAWGAHADDDTFRVLPVARPGDTELDVLVWNLPRELEPRGFIQFDFDDVAITVAGVEVPSVAVVPTAGVYAGVAPPASPVPDGASLGAVPNTAAVQQAVGGAGQAGTPVGTATTTPTTPPSTTPTTTPTTVGGVQAEATPVATDGLSDPVKTEQVAPQADTTLPGPASQLGGVTEPFLNPGRVAISTQTGTQPAVQTPGLTTTPIVPDAFLTQNNEGRVALSASEPAPVGQLGEQLPTTPTSPVVPDAFQNPARVTNPSPATAGGFVPLTAAPQSTSLSTRGTFSVVPLVPGVAGPELAFGGTRVTSGLVRTPSPAQVATPAVPLVSTPAPLNSQPPVPLVSNPLPLNGQPAVPLVASPPPLNSQPISATLPGTPASAAAPSTSTVPGLVSSPNTATTAPQPTSAPPPGAVPSP
ncbi:hypothetical protein [Vitiosangium sp. GDMCC 1.1324]|uniref:hypothetical protein n=1 Tax=Vitiosangium sp. (strain GDMCC 1.1324) TaxID=2138576 RepID=UPI0018EE4A17|nr:hypothetical protein [Vitiosangium sp. GDMCC 1.1324]